MPTNHGTIIIKLTGLAVVILLALNLVACGGLSGTYNSRTMDGATFNNERLQSVEFKSFGDAEIITDSFYSSTTYPDSSYKISGNTITLKAEWNYTDKWEGSYSYRESGNSIYIDGIEYSK